MKTTIYYCYLLLILSLSNFCQAQGFINNINWPLPNFGAKGYGVTNNFGNGFTSTRFWDIIDLNGDHKKDLVVFADSGKVFNYTTNPNWEVYINNGNAFSPTPLIWSLPIGGIKYNGIYKGFIYPFNIQAYVFDVGSQNWTMKDMNGDGLLDLVVTGELQSNGKVTVWDAGINPYWKIYLNNGNGFDINATNWYQPIGGVIEGGLSSGFNTPIGYNESNEIGTQNFELEDMNGDGKTDLVVESEIFSTDFTVYDPMINPYWKVYLNSGSSFQTSPVNWSLPIGGLITMGFINMKTYNTSQTIVGNQLWCTTDINGDLLPDLVVTSEVNSGGNLTVYNPTAPYWKVYINNGNGFSTSFIQWNVPTGGVSVAGLNKGYYMVENGYNGTIGDIGSEFWSLLDIDGDLMKDLVIYSTRATFNTYPSFNVSTNPYWKIYNNYGSNFNQTSINWSFPLGGLIYNSHTAGFNMTECIDASVGIVPSQNWDLDDLNNDGYVDLIITSEKGSSGVTVYDPVNNPHWKIYMNYLTGVAEQTDTTNNLPVFPNPFHNQISLNIGSNEKIEKINITDPAGRPISTINNPSTIVDLSSLPSGLYIIRIDTDKGSCFEKIIKE